MVEELTAPARPSAKLSRAKEEDCPDDAILRKEEEQELALLSSKAAAIAEALAELRALRAAKSDPEDEDLMCPITCELMQDPVTTKDGTWLRP